MAISKWLAAFKLELKKKVDILMLGSGLESSDFLGDEK